MIPTLTWLRFLADGLMVAATAWNLVCTAGLDRRGFLEPFLAWLLLGLAWIVASGVLLGQVGQLGAGGFLTLHALGWAVILVVRRGAHDFRRGRRWWADRVDFFRNNQRVGWITGWFVAVFLILALLAAAAEPIVFDALTYRLSRIGLWLQSGSIEHFQTDDPRLNYMPVGPDVVVAWLIGVADDGYRLAAWSQIAGGALLVGATFGLARDTGLSRMASFAAVILALGMANVAAQLTAVQSDLFTAGIFSASFLLWNRADRRGEASTVAGLGVALAFGSKGTMFYLAPGAALWVGLLAWKRRTQFRVYWRTAGATVFAALIFVLPGLWRNHVTYGRWFGPDDAVVQQHGPSFALREHVGKTFLNLASSGIQLFDPPAQPLALQGLSRSAGNGLIKFLPATSDSYVFMNVPRSFQLQKVMELEEPDCDYLSFGLTGAGLFLGGLVVAIIFRRSAGGAGLVLVWSGGVLLFIVTQHALVQWNHWQFRFMVLVAPWMAVVAAWGLGRLPVALRASGWTVALFCSAQVFAMVQWRAPQAAWRAITEPDRSLGHFVYHRWRDWAGHLEPVGGTVTVALPINAPISALLRLSPPNEIVLRRLDQLPSTAEGATRALGGWLIVPAKFYDGREGRVEKRVWALNGDEASPYSVAAYRRRPPD